MNQFVWSEVRDSAIRQFQNQTPSAELEQEILEAFLADPLRIVNEIGRVAKKLADGKIQSAWPILRLNVRQMGERPDAVATDASSRAKAVARAENWIRSAGIWCPSEGELLGELYGVSERTPPLGFLIELEASTRSSPGRYVYDALLHAQIARTMDEGEQAIPETAGVLRPWAGDEPLREQLLELWRAERPRGQLLEAEMERRAAEFVLQRKVTKAKTEVAA